MIKIYDNRGGLYSKHEPYKSPWSDIILIWRKGLFGCSRIDSPFDPSIIHY